MSKKLTIEYVKKSFEKEGYELLSKEYIDAQYKLKYKCPKGHEHSITWYNWYLGKRCPYCAGQGKPNIEFIRFEFNKENYVFLTKKYKNAHQKLEYICSEGHKHNITWNMWQRVNRCPYCNGQGKPTVEFIKSEFAKEDYTLLTNKYKNNQQKLEYICPKGHRHNVTWHNWNKNRRCPYCYGNISKGEIELRNFVKSLDMEVSANNRNQIFNPKTGYGFELDIFMPTLNKAIEYNGEYWHQDKERDLLKQKLCKLKGINLLTIWDKEWVTNSGKYKSKIIDFIEN